MDAGDVIDVVREHLSDVGKTAWTDANLLIGLSDSLRRVETWRPDLLLVDGDTLGTVADVDAVGDTLPFPVVAREALGLLTAAWALRRDSDDQADLNRAVAYEQMARRSLGVK